MLAPSTTGGLSESNVVREQVTEIDDAMSVTRLPDGKVRIGIHIAAPALGIKRDDALEAVQHGVDAVAIATPRRDIGDVRAADASRNFQKIEFAVGLALDEFGVRRTVH